MRHVEILGAPPEHWRRHAEESHPRDALKYGDFNVAFRVKLDVRDE